MNINITNTDKENYFCTENFTREIFWNLYSSGCTDHLILHNLRKSKSHIPELDLIALHDDKLLGHIISTKAKVIDAENIEHEVLCVGPFAILEEYRARGIGSKLMNYSIEKARELGYKGMILFGDPNYYHRFGFANAKKYGITTKDNQNFDPFMALELKEDSLKNINGRFFEDKVFFPSDKEFEEFDAQFPAKEKGEPKIKINV